MHRQPTYHRIKGLFRDWMVEGVAAKVCDAIGQTAPLCEIHGDVVQIGLQLKRRDVAASGMR